ncbi:hypothetical protein K8Z61_09230 [Nocardioides sp. TRM66260-LWL]|uniref:hypothetical protein n=1 Tax=Nocardioides sp. TRM66260-LWL TaxID=2874478 RepID=UPI001CC39F26|nr:hypothetical protein [Nocardioides sp. TRM66260-LWL]MBZ5734678.1 hypothetical protein [Nocardioides sp. TRM66260-LWL]
MLFLRNVGVVLAAGLVGLLAANGIAYAATGHGVTLGGSNASATATGLTRTKPGPALALTVKPGSAPLAVSSGALVKHLNADEVDGRSAAELQTRATRFVVPPLGTPTSRSVLVLDGVKHGLYQASFNILTTTSAPGTGVSCYLSTDLDQGTADNQLTAYGASFLSFSTANSSGFLDFRTGPGIALSCFAPSGQTFDYGDADQATVTLVPIDALTVRRGAVHPPAAARQRAASTAQGR